MLDVRADFVPHHWSGPAYYITLPDDQQIQVTPDSLQSDRFYAFLFTDDPFQPGVQYIDPIEGLTLLEALGIVLSKIEEETDEEINYVEGSWA